MIGKYKIDLDKQSFLDSNKILILFYLLFNFGFYLWVYLKTGSFTHSAYIAFYKLGYISWTIFGVFLFFILFGHSLFKRKLSQYILTINDSGIECVTDIQSDSTKISFCDIRALYISKSRIELEGIDKSYILIPSKLFNYNEVLQFIESKLNQKLIHYRTNNSRLIKKVFIISLIIIVFLINSYAEKKNYEELFFITIIPVFIILFVIAVGPNRIKRTFYFFKN